MRAPPSPSHLLREKNFSQLSRFQLFRSNAADTPDPKVSEVSLILSIAEEKREIARGGNRTRKGERFPKSECEISCRIAEEAEKQKELWTSRAFFLRFLLGLALCTPRRRIVSVAYYVLLVAEKRLKGVYHVKRAREFFGLSRDFVLVGRKQFRFSFVFFFFRFFFARVKPLREKKSETKTRSAALPLPFRVLSCPRDDRTSQLQSCPGRWRLSCKGMEMHKASEMGRNRTGNR